MCKPLCEGGKKIRSSFSDPNSRGGGNIQYLGCNDRRIAHRKRRRIIVIQHGFNI